MTEKKKRGRKPKILSQIIAPIKETFNKTFLQKIFYNIEDFGKKIGKFIMYLIRGSEGLSPEAESQTKMYDSHDELQNSRFTPIQAYAQVYKRLVAKTYPKVFSLMETWASLESRAFISLNGEQRKEQILIEKAKGIQLPQQQTLTLPSVDTKQEIKTESNVETKKGALK
jgi:hypothetical protein